MFPLLHNLHMRLFPVICLVVLPALAVAENTSSPASTPDPAIASNLKVLELHLAHTQQRIAELEQDLTRQDKRFEAAVERILGMVAAIRDSKDSGSKTVRMKEDLMEALASTIESYQQKKRALEADLTASQPTIDPSASKESINALDERIEKRIDQILQLSKTMVSSSDYQKYNEGRKETRRNRYGGTQRDDAYRQAQKTTTRAGQNRKQINAALEEQIEELEQRERQLQERLKHPQATEEAKAYYREELSHLDELIERRYGQLEGSVTTGSGPGKKGGSKVAMRDALEMDRIINKMGQDLEWDLNSIFRTFNEWTVERKKAYQLEQQIQHWQKVSGAAPAAPATPAKEVTPAS